MSKEKTEGSRTGADGNVQDVLVAEKTSPKPPSDDLDGTFITETPKTGKRGKKRGNLAYVGYTLPGILRHGMVFEGGELPGAVSACVERFPAMGRLFVPIEDIPEACKEIQRGGGLKSICDEAARINS